MQDSEYYKKIEEQLPGWILDLEGFVRQFIELELIGGTLREVMNYRSDQETLTHADIRQVYEREIQSRKDYLAELIAVRIVELFRRAGIVDKYPELRTTRNALSDCIR